ncbi:MAG: pyrroloquinoline quinone biosynthesis peptide chaperone PqqD [Pleurocapsa sp. MO_226.B13]|nr:pyrroloquinoline quinone biosynthesis peptide chaperone PqqD [Pleurocapsa sp. MO_226.B13]
MGEKKQIKALDYLDFAVGVRLHHCEVRQQHWLLFPEGAIALNDNAIAILALCNGDRSFDELVTELKKQFSNVKPRDIQDFLSYMARRGLLTNRI